MNPLGIQRQRSSRAFTLIELLVVIVILGILMAVAVPTFLRQQSKAQDSRTQQYLTTAYKAIRTVTPDNGNVYPSSTSMVSWIKQSEPELTAQRGDCLLGISSAPQDAVLVDPSSTANSLTLCARSQSGNVWKLTATATSAPTLLDGTLVPFTATGPVINDAYRATGVQGDGLSNDSSTALYEPTTNLIKNGGFETDCVTNVGPWGGTNNETHVRSTTTSKFGSASCLVGTDGTAINQGISFHDSTDTYGRIPISAGSTYTFSAWVKGTTGTEVVYPSVSDYNNVPAGITGCTGPQITLSTTTWQQVSCTFTAPAGAVDVWPAVSTTSTPQAVSFYVDGAQLEAKPLITPYVDTTGVATASRAASRLQIPSSVLNATQGWAAFRVRMGFSSAQAAAVTNNQGVSLRLLDWQNDNTNRLLVVLGQGTSGFNTYRQMVGTEPNAGTGNQTWNAGDQLTIIAKWDAANVYISYNGGAFTSQADPTVPNLTVTTADIGQLAGVGNYFDGDFLWAAFGTGTLSNADAATITGWGSTDPSRSSFPSAAQATLVWNGAGTSGSLK